MHPPALRRVPAFWASAVLVVTVAIGLPPAPGATDSREIAPAAGAGDIDATAQFVSTVPIAVPEFRGLEPSLDLSYASGSGNSFLGMGWTLGGQSFIERAAPGRGAPRWNSSDIHLLDGDELVAGCTMLGGTHCRRQQDYSRIRWVAGNDIWEVWSTDGTKSTYSPIYRTAWGTFRYGLTEERDTRGNAVTYTYWRQAPENAYLDSITYNGTTIRFHRESRPDRVSFSNGEFVGYTSYRLKTIDITVGGQRARAYTLTYRQASSTGRSVMTGVREFGRDAVLDASGTVTAGTALPEVTLGYQYGEARFPAMNANGSVGGWNPSTIRDLFGDVNGDGKIDLVRVWQNGSNAYARVTPSNGNGFSSVSFNSSIGGWNPAWRTYLADVTGDGMADLVTIWQHPDGVAYAQVNPSNGAGYPSRSFNSSVGGWNPSTIKDFLADVNGDYKADLVRIYKNGANAFAYVRLSNGSGFAAPSFNGSVGGWSDSALDYLSDISGDGRVDLIRIWNNGDAYAQVNLSSGTGFPAQNSNSPVGGWNPGRVANHFADLNGDGKADLVRIYPHNDQAYAYVRLSTGRGFADPSFNGSVGGWNPATVDDHFADVNGDGRTDLIRTYPLNGNTYAQVTPYNGVGFAGTSFNSSIGGWNSAWKTHLVDVSGDGKSDAVTIWQHPDGNAYAQARKASGVAPDLLTSMANGIGGNVTTTYTPSTRWWSPGRSVPAVFPTVSTVTTGDGRGTAWTTRYGFANPAWALEPSERRFLGYGHNTAVLDSDGTYEETFFRQTLASAGGVERRYRKNGAGLIYHYEQNAYRETTAPPYISLVSTHSNFECNLTATCRQTRTDYTHDAYGNTITEVDHGDYGRSGDEVTAASVFRPNTDTYLVDLPSEERSHLGTSTSGEQLAKTLHYYDGSTEQVTPPIKGDATMRQEWNSDTGGYVTATSRYDAFGNVTSATDARGSTTTTAYDDTYSLFPVRSCNALAQCSTKTWDYTLGLPASTTDPNNSVTRFGYDAFGRPATETDPAGNTTTWQYADVGDPAKQRIRQTLPDGSGDGLWNDTFYDGLGRGYQTIKEGPGAGVSYVQDRMYKSTTPLVWKESLWRMSGDPATYTTFSFDGEHRLTRTTHPDGSSATIGYANGADALPYVRNVDELGHEQVSWSDVDGRLTQVRETNGAVPYTTTYQHDPLGRLLRWTDANGDSSIQTWNSLGWRTSITDMDKGRWTYGYDDGGLLVRQTDAKGQITTFTHDQLGRPKTKTLADGKQAQWFYDEAGHGAGVGRLTRVIYPSGSDSHTWNSLGLEVGSTQCVDAICQSVGNSYDALARLETVTYPDGEAVGYSFDSAGRLAGVGGYVTAMTWNPVGQLTGMTQSNGTRTTYSYDPNRQWLTGAAVKLNGVPLYQASYTYDAAGRATSMSQGTPTPSTVNFGYDDLDRLTALSGAQNQTFSYDPVGNITSNSLVGAYAYNDPAHKHAVTAAGPATYTYDANGNLTGGDGRTIAWDPANRLSGVTKGGVSSTFAYDEGGTRLKKTAGNSTTRYFSPFAEEVDGALVKHYYAGPLLVAKKQADAPIWYHGDRLGSTRLMTNAAGQEVKEYDYQPYGQLHSSSGAADNERTFTGHIHDDTSGLLYMGARYQDPKLGRFISADDLVPDLGEPQDLNRYSYVRNNPVNLTDPTGQRPAGCEGACLRRSANAYQRAIINRSAPRRTSTRHCYEAHACPSRRGASWAENPRSWRPARKASAQSTRRGTRHCLSGVDCNPGAYRWRRPERNSSRHRDVSSALASSFAANREHGSSTSTDQVVQPTAHRDSDCARDWVSLKCAGQGFAAIKRWETNVHGRGWLWLADVAGGQSHTCGTGPTRCVSHSWLIVPWAEAGTLGNSIVCRGQCDSETVSHEAVHVEQFQEGGRYFIYAYAWESMFGGIGRDNKYERPAYEVGLGSG